MKYFPITILPTVEYAYGIHNYFTQSFIFANSIFIYILANNSKSEVNCFISNKKYYSDNLHTTSRDKWIMTLSESSLIINIISKKISTENRCWISNTN